MPKWQCCFGKHIIVIYIVMAIHKAVRVQHFIISYSDMQISNLVTVIVFSTCESV